VVARKSSKRLLRRLALLALALAIPLGAYVALFLTRAGVFDPLEPRFAGHCSPVSGLIGGEDIDRLEGGPILVSSADFRALSDGNPRRGSILRFVPESSSLEPLTDDLDGSFVPHGISLFRDEQTGSTRLFVVNHPDNRTSLIEVFDLDAAAGALHHRRTISSPEIRAANDVVAVGPDEAYVTNSAAYPLGHALRMVESFLMLSTANVVHINGDSVRIVMRGLAFANGIDCDTSCETLYVAETVRRRLVAYERSAEGDLTLRTSVDIPSGLDNLYVDEGSIWIGSHPRMLDFLGHATDPEALSPSHVIRVHRNGPDLRAEDLFVSDGSDLSGLSVAVPLSETRFLVGSVFEDHLLDCTMD